MIYEKPRTTALAIGSTTAILYSSCALAFALFPDLTAGFINSINHGANLQVLEVGKVTFTFGSFLLGLIYITGYAVVAGYIYGVTRNALQRREGEQLELQKATPARTS